MCMMDDRYIVSVCGYKISCALVAGWRNMRAGGWCRVDWSRVGWDWIGLT